MVMKTLQHQPRLVADIGGTYARFGLVGGEGEVERILALRSAEFSGLREAIGAYLSMAGAERPPRQAAVAVASPATGDRIEFTNLPWSFSIAQLRAELGLDRLLVLNDFTALALALPELPAEATTRIKDGEAMPGAPLAVLGPGTGLGVGALVPAGEDWIPLASEGGHRDLAPVSEREWQVCEALRAAHGRVSCERVLSGPGLLGVYRSLCRLAEQSAEELEPRDVVERARARACPHCTEAVELFCAQLGAVAGDLALTLGARGGLFLGGGIVTRMGAAFRSEAFIRRFEAKGRLSDYLRRIPVRRIDHPSPTLFGAARALQRNVKQ